jgi:hypothetical protein
MSTVYLLIGESGEYSDRYETIHGVFQTEHLARTAIAEIHELARREWEALKSFRASVRAQAEANGFPYAYPLDDRDKSFAHSKETIRITEALGGEPPYSGKSERYAVVSLSLDLPVSLSPDFEEQPALPA